jgi:hypothetical protein
VPPGDGRTRLGGACRKVCEQVKRWSDWVGLWTGLPSWGPRELRSHPANSTAICKLCDRPLRAHLVEAREAIGRAEEIVRKAQWLTDEDYDAA